MALGRDYSGLDLCLIESNAVRCPDPAKAAEMEALIMKVKSEGDTIGGIVSCVIRGVRPEWATLCSVGSAHDCRKP